MTDRSHTRRDAANGFFVTLHTAVLGATGLIADKLVITRFKCLILVLFGIGIILAFAWRLRVKSFRQLHSGKFKVIHELERQLPAQPYDQEWKHLGQGMDTKKYLPMTVTEIIIPWTFGLAYVVAAGVALAIT